jgi:bifunctional pyridoxal-dependent enzyme with beta-cystathionase and maltose regulon repressor activities
MVVVNSPSNPTGWLMTEGEQRALYDLAERHDLMILADEVYERLVYDGPIAPSFARVAQNSERLIVVNSFSKTYNMTWMAARLGAGQRTHDPADVQGCRVHDVQPGGDRCSRPASWRCATASRT